MAKTSYAIGLGSNRRHGRHGGPAAVLSAAVAALAAAGVTVRRVSRIHRTPALGPGGRDYANAVALVDSDLPPPAMLALVKGLEGEFGRRRGRRWGARVLDLDLLLWSGGGWRQRRPTLAIPHAGLPGRRFVLDPLTEVAARWPVPMPAGRTTPARLRYRLMRPRPIDRAAKPS